MSRNTKLQHLERHVLSRRQIVRGLTGLVGAAVGIAPLSACGQSFPSATLASPATPWSSLTTASPTRATTIASPAVGTTLYVYRGHALGVFSVAWSPDGERIASGSFDKTVQVWDALTGNHVVIYRGHTDQVNEISWSPNGRYIASSGDGTVQIWDAMTGKQMFIKGNQTSKQYGTAWSLDGQAIMTGDGNTVYIWDVLTGKLIYSFGNVSQPVESTRWSPDGRYIAAFGSDTTRHVPTVQIWKADKGEMVYAYDIPNGQRSAQAWSPDSKRVVIASSTGLVQARDIPYGTNIITFTSVSVPTGVTNTLQWLNVGWSPDGSSIAAGSYEGPIQMWNASTGKTRYVYREQKGDVQAIAWSPNSRYIASTGDAVRVWQAT